MGGPFIRFYANYPVRLPDCAVAKTFCLVNSDPRCFTEDDIASMKDIAHIVEDEFEIINMVMIDSLTDIPNRRGFYPSGERRFQALQQRHADFALLYFDQDKFKPFNNMWGTLREMKG